MSVYFVFLRRPGSLSDRRDDPFWEFGSFGKTGCHRKNLLHPQHSRLQDGDRLAFLQGGRGEIRVVGLTPPIKIAGSVEQIEVRWDKAYRPLPYLAAPLLISNDGGTAFPSVFSALRLRDTNRSTLCGAAASRLRSRTTKVMHELALDLIHLFASKRLPRITAYAQTVEPESGTWFKQAIRAGWAGAARRADEYNRAGRPKTRAACATRKPIKRPSRGC